MKIEYVLLWMVCMSSYVGISWMVALNIFPRNFLTLIILPSSIASALSIYVGYQLGLKNNVEKTK